MYIENKLKKHGFSTERLTYLDENRVRKFNIVGKKGSGTGGIGYACHSDVVPAEIWHSKVKGPFEPGIARDRLYGRGSCDMKGSIGCMLEAVQNVSWSEMHSPIYFICTADEECGYTGAKEVVAKSKYYREMVENQTPLIIGEPTLLDVVHAHKGSCLIEAVARGKSAHSSTREGVNANLAMIPFLAEAKSIYEETESNADFKNALFDPPTLSWNIGINDYTPAINMTADRSRCTIYFRPMPDVAHEPLVQRLQDVAKQQEIEFRVQEYGKPLWTDPDSEFVRIALELSRKRKARTVGFGTDGGVFDELKNKIVYGPGNIAQAHTENEWIAIEQLTLGTQMFTKFLKRFCCEGPAVDK